ncbi:hypothetical protein BJY04DRAFT_231099 [Aspergillus karnatakaensis]|uniref:uncharacterized protein n=1 Tax=Aspergillus karnatakaensis TaxID=1810916 RepID=UPI003CCDBDF4
MASNEEYPVDEEIAHFFEKTTATRAACDAYAAEHFGGEVIPVAVQGVCSYTVYVGSSSEFVIQFRLRSLALKVETVNLARTKYGHFAPQVAFRGQIGDDMEGREPVYIYVMNRVPGVSYLDFILTYNSRIPESSATFSSWRKTLVTDIAKFFALSWKSTQTVDQTYRDELYHQYKKELELLLTSLPCPIFSLPMVLLHRDFGVCNIMVDEKSCNLKGVIDWAEAEIAPFGLNLHSHQRLISRVYLKNGWTRYDDYITFEEIFWATLRKEAGGLDDETIRVIKLARVVGLLLSRGFSRLANQPVPVPIQDDEHEAYRMRDLDGLLINPDTRFTELT